MPGAGNKSKIRAFTLGARRSLNRHATLVGELNNERNSANRTQSEKNSAVTLGAIMFL